MVTQAPDPNEDEQRLPENSETEGDGEGQLDPSRADRFTWQADDVVIETPEDDEEEEE